MEKIKPILMKIRGHHFWILVIFGAAVILYCWNASVSEIERDFQKNKRAVSAQFTSLKTNSQRSEFPNEIWIEETKNAADKVTKSAAVAWKGVVDMQQPAVQWPEDILGAGFAEVFANPESDEEKSALVAAYAEAAPKLIGALRETLGATKIVESEEGVLWEQSNYDLLQDGYATTKIKTARDCEIRQKALWVYQAMARVIAETNRGEEDQFNLPIHTVKELAVGELAARRLNEGEWKIQEVSAATPPGTKEQAVPKGRSSRSKRGKTNKASRNTKAKSKVILQPPLGTLISKPVPVDGYELVAFRMQVRMDANHLNKLLIAFSNSEIPLEIQGLRFHRSVALQVAKSPETKKTVGNNPPVPSWKLRTSKGKKPPKNTAESGANQEESSRGTLIEVWGYAYLVKNKDFISEGAAKDSGQAKNARQDPRGKT